MGTLTLPACPSVCVPSNGYRYRDTLPLMRVLIVTTWLATRSHPATGAFVVKDARAIADAGHEVAIIHLVPPSQLGGTGCAALGSEASAIDGLPITRIVMSTTSPRQIAAAGRKLARLTAGADLVHTMAFSTLLPMAWWRPEAPWVHTEHWSGIASPHLLPKSWRAVMPWLKPLLSRPDVVTAVCDYLLRPITDVRGESLAVVVPCIVPAPENIVPRRTDPDPVRLVSIGGLVDGKDPLMALETVAELARRGVDTSLRWVGEGPLRERVQQRAEELGISQAVTLTGTLDRAGVLAELAAADLFLGPTRGDNFFVSCAEALRSGRPVVVGATGGQGEYIDTCVGLCVAEHIAPAYADAVQEVLRMTKGLSAEAISATLGNAFDPEEVAMGYQRAYDLALAAR